MYQKIIFLIVFSLFLLSAGRQVQAQQYTNDTLWQASVGGTITDIFFSPDDKYLVVVGYNSDLCPSFFDAKTGELLLQINEAKNSFFGDFSLDGKLFICAKNDGKEFLVYDLEKKEVIKRIPMIGYMWLTGVFTKNGSEVWVSQYDPGTNPDKYYLKIVVFDTETWEAKHEIERAWSHSLKSSPDGRYVGYRGNEAIIVRNTETYEIHKIFRMPERINDFAFSADGTMIAGTCEGSNSLMIWDLESGVMINEIYDEKIRNQRKVSFSSDSRYIITGVGLNPWGNYETAVYDVKNLNKVHIYPDKASYGLSISKDNKYVAICFSGIVVYHAQWGETSVSDIPEEENIIYPNPATGIVNIMLDIKKAETIDVNIYDTSGNIITNIFNGIAEPGTILTWNSSENPSGTYYCKVESRSFNKSYKIIVSK